jgi:hypothetical protein
VFVAAAVSILHHHGWLGAVDGYAFILIGNLSAGLPKIPPRDWGDLRPLALAKAIIVEIDQVGFEDRYRGRSPLDRCQLLDDLFKLYRARPALLVVDIDLSPALWITKVHADASSALERERQRACELGLYRLIEERADEVETVLMDPFELADPDASRAKKDWKCSMEASGVHFGSAQIPVSFGLALRGEAGPHSLVGVAAGALGDQRHRDASHDEGAILIDPRLYRGPGGLGVVSVRELESGYVEFYPGGRVESWNGWHYLGGRIVFFGAGYGSEEDTYLTPGGEFYGVEVQAAALLSRLDPLSEHSPLSLLADLAFAGAFGLATAWCWDRYREDRKKRGQPGRRGTAGVWVILLGVTVIGLLAVSLKISTWLLQDAGVWSSPLPVMIGMMIDSITGRWLEDVEGGHRDMVTHHHGWLASAVECTFNVPASLWRANPWAAVWVVGRILLWIGVVGYAFSTIFGVG